MLDHILDSPLMESKIVKSTSCICFVCLASLCKYAHSIFPSSELCLFKLAIRFRSVISLCSSSLGLSSIGYSFDVLPNSQNLFSRMCSSQ